uniref:TRAF3-interacting protein 1 n=1 Tax=Rhodnius prolixus TaxID=13249 RepID=T1I0X3_RHOPR
MDTNMSEVISPEDIKKTQSALTKYINQPPLTEKLLRKPPFRFLYDIIKSVIRETGFLSEVFTAEDLNLENVKDKEGKIAFLKKLIAAVKDATGNPISAKPNKIAAGLEVTKTLELLQAVGKGIALKQSGKLNIQKENPENKQKSNVTTAKENNAGTSKKLKLKKDDVQNDADKTKQRGGNSGKENATSDRKKKERIDKVEKEKIKKKDNAGNNKKDLNEKNEREVIDEKDQTKNEKEIDGQIVTKVNENLENSQIVDSNSSKIVENRHSPPKSEQLNNGETNEKVRNSLASNDLVENGLPADKEEENKLANDVNNEEQKKKEETSAKADKRPSTRRQSSRTRPPSKNVSDNVKKDAETKVVEKPDDSNSKKVKKEIQEDTLPLLGAGEAPPITVPK